MGIRMRDLTAETNFPAHALTLLTCMTDFFELPSPAIGTVTSFFTEKVTLPYLTGRRVWASSLVGLESLEDNNRGHI